MQRGGPEIPQFQSHWKHLRPHQGSILFTWKQASVALKGKTLLGERKIQHFYVIRNKHRAPSSQGFRLSILLGALTSSSQDPTRVCLARAGSEMCASSTGSFQWGNVRSPQVKGQPLRVTWTWCNASMRSNPGRGGGRKAAKEALHSGLQSAKWLTHAGPVPTQPQLCFKLVKTEILISHCGSRDNRHVE